MTASARQDRGRSLSALVLGFRFFALAVVAGTAAFLRAEETHRPLVVAGVLGAAASAVLQHLAVPRVPRPVAMWFVLPHTLSWTALIHGTGGQGSPLALGYLLELPLSGALFARPGVAVATAASAILYLAYAGWIGGPFQPAAAATLLGYLGVCAGISWHVVGMLERQRSRIEASQEALAYRAESLAEELRLLGDSLGDALVSIDEAGRIASLNPSGAALLGVDPSTEIGKPWQEVLGPDPVSRRLVAETLDSGKAQRGVTMVLSPAPRTVVTVRAEMWLGSGREGRRAHLLLDPGTGSGPDDPVRRLGESAACVAHQIKNSMHALQGFVRSLGQTTEAGAGRIADECLAALRNLGALAEDMLAMAGASRPQRENVAVQEVLRSAMALLGQPAIRMSIPLEPLYVEVRRGLLVHAIFNLLDNAIRKNAPGRTVTLQVAIHDGWVIVDIDDAGPGIPPGFAHAQGALPSRNGAGLGLMAARRFVQECGGRLSLAAMEAGGTRCHLELRAASLATEQAVGGAG